MHIDAPAEERGQAGSEQAGRRVSVVVIGDGQSGLSGGYTEVHLFGHFTADGRMRRAHMATRTVPSHDSSEKGSA